MSVFYPHYRKKDYWETHYKTHTEYFDFYQDWKGIKDIVTQYFKQNTGYILYSGCGLSKLPEEMYNHGFRQIISIDFSKRCIQTMRKKFTGMPNTFQFLEMDSLDMDFGDGTFQYVLDKGLFDSIASGYDSTDNVLQYMTEVLRVLKPGGFFIFVSYRHPQHRTKFFNLIAEQWKDCETYKVYKKQYEVEKESIKKAFVDKKVLEEMEKHKVIQKKEDEEDNGHDVEMLEGYQEFLEKMKENEEYKKFLPYVEGDDWTQDMEEMPCHYIYVLQKAENEDNSMDNYENTESEYD